ncbi:MAG TPA: ATPase, T2SS/T4P/T4SS family [Nitrososphaerales archaeon]|nr:ATPase, T2SS/T4P/T4SS family [Nitrososphaerales archaeon]
MAENAGKGGASGKPAATNSKQAEEDRKREEKRQRKERERLAKAEAKRKQIEEENRRKLEELQRKEAERKAKEQAKLRERQENEKRKAEERARKEAERRDREERERREQAEKARLKAEKEARERAEKQAKELEDRKRREEEELRKVEERTRKEAERRAREEAERKRKEEDKAAEEAERKAKEEEERKKREEEAKRRQEEVQARESERRSKDDLQVRKAQVAEVARAQAEVTVAARTPAASRTPTQSEEKRRQSEMAIVLGKVNVRFPLTGSPIPPAWKVLERYPVNSPFAYAVVAQSPLGVRRYFLDEVPLTKTEAGIYSYLLDALEDELTVPRTEVNPRQYFAGQARRILLKYSVVVPATSWAKIVYFAERDLVGFGVIDGFMRDPNIEDISIDAVGRPLYIYHKGHESLETNVALADDESLDNIVTRLSHMAGKHVSTAFPIVQGTLPGRHRLIATFRREVSPMGSSATIRKFREDPLTIIDMINLNVVDHRLAAYVWLMMQNRATAIVVGSTGAGKTTLLNALLTLTRLNSKIVTIEEVQEINISHQNWTSLVSRESYAATEEKAGAVDLFDLVKAAMRMRPDILVVGEVRGEEAYVLFQAISTGHGGICTLHADDSASALQRLTSEPMNVPPAFIPFLDLSIVVRRISVPTSTGGFRAMRRVISVDEILTDTKVNTVFKYEPRTDTFAALPLDKSIKVQNLASDQGLAVSAIVEEIERRSVVLRWLKQKGIRNFREVAQILELFASRPEETYERALSELQAAGVPMASPRGAPPG